MRVLDAAGEQPAGLHHLVAGVVDGRRRVVDGADQRELVGVLGHLREDLGDLRCPGTLVVIGWNGPRTSAGAFGLRVPGVDVAGAADAGRA